MTEHAKPGYYAVIPAEVRYNQELPANAKLLYGEISALSNAYGYCYATNAYFSAAFGWSERSVQRLLLALARDNFIRTEVAPGTDGQQAALRKIYIIPEFYATDYTVPETPQGVTKLSPPHDKTFIQGVTKMSPATNNKNNIKNNITAREELKNRFAVWAEQYAAEGSPLYARLLKSYEGFAEHREALKHPLTPQAHNLLLSKLLKLSGGKPEAMAELMDEAVLNGWRGIYPLDRKRSRPAPTEEDVTWL